MEGLGTVWTAEGTARHDMGHPWPFKLSKHFLTFPNGGPLLPPVELLLGCSGARKHRLLPIQLPCIAKSIVRISLWVSFVSLTSSSRMLVQSLKGIQGIALRVHFLQSMQRLEEQKFYQCILMRVNVRRWHEQTFNLRHFWDQTHLLNFNAPDPIGGMKRNLEKMICSGVLARELVGSVNPHGVNIQWQLRDDFVVEASVHVGFVAAGQVHSSRICNRRRYAATVSFFNLSLVFSCIRQRFFGRGEPRTLGTDENVLVVSPVSFSMVFAADCMLEVS